MKDVHRRRNRQLGYSLVASLVLVVLALRVPEQHVILLNVFMTFLVLGLTLDLLVGDLHLFSGCSAAFFGAGSYVSVLLWQDRHWPLPLGAVAAAVVVLILSLAIGWPATLRTGGMTFAIVTFAFGELMVLVVDNTTTVTAGSEGFIVQWGLGKHMPFGVSIYRYFSFWLVGAVLLTLVFVVCVRNSQLGLRLKAIREDPVQARGMGYNLTAYRTSIFVVTSVIGGLLGVLYAPMMGVVNPDQMSIDQSIYILGLIIVGGMGRMLGVTLGILLLAIIPQYYQINPTLRPIIVGAAMVIIVLVEPGGLAVLVDRAGAALRQHLPLPRGRRPVSEAAAGELQAAGPEPRPGPAGAEAGSSSPAPAAIQSRGPQ